MIKLIKLFLLIVILSGCASKRAYNLRSSEVGYYGDTKSNLIMTREESSKPLYEKENDNQRVIVFDASLTLEVKNPDTASVQVMNLAKKYNGYVVVSSNKYIQIRVNAKNLNDAILDITKLGKLKDKTITGTDVTDEYKDYGIRLDNAQKARERYLELLSKAQNVKEALEVEKELERLNGEIDLLKGKINRLEHLSAYSTITVYLQQKIVLGPVGLALNVTFKLIKLLFVIK